MREKEECMYLRMYLVNRCAGVWTNHTDTHCHHEQEKKKESV